jgi:hypothetical protein
VAAMRFTKTTLIHYNTVTALFGKKKEKGVGKEKTLVSGWLRSYVWYDVAGVLLSDVRGKSHLWDSTMIAITTRHLVH